MFVLPIVTALSAELASLPNFVFEQLVDEFINFNAFLLSLTL